MEEYAAPPVNDAFVVPSQRSPARALNSWMSVPRTPHGIRGLAAPTTPTGMFCAPCTRHMFSRQVAAVHESPPVPPLKASLDQQESSMANTESMGLPLSESVSPVVSRDHSRSSLRSSESQPAAEPRGKSTLKEELRRRRQVAQRLRDAKNREAKLWKYLATYKMSQLDTNDAGNPGEEPSGEYSATPPCTPLGRGLRPRDRSSAGSCESLAAISGGIRMPTSSVCGSPLSASDEARGAEESGDSPGSPSGVLPTSQQSFLPRVSAFQRRRTGGVTSTGSISAVRSDSANGRSSSCGTASLSAQPRSSLPRLTAAVDGPTPEKEPSRPASDADRNPFDAVRGASPLMRPHDESSGAPPLPVFIPCNRFVNEPSDAKVLSPAKSRARTLPSSNPRVYRAKVDGAGGGGTDAAPERAVVPWLMKCREPIHPAITVTPPSPNVHSKSVDDAASPQLPPPKSGEAARNGRRRLSRPLLLRLGSAGGEATTCDEPCGAGYHDGQKSQSPGCYTPASPEVMLSAGYDTGVSGSCRSPTPIARSPTIPEDRPSTPLGVSVNSVGAAQGAPEEQAVTRNSSMTGSVTAEVPPPSPREASSLTEFTAMDAGLADTTASDAELEHSFVPRRRRSPLAEAFLHRFGDLRPRRGLNRSLAATPAPTVAREPAEADALQVSDTTDQLSQSDPGIRQPPSTDDAVDLSLLLFDAPAFTLPSFR